MEVRGLLKDGRGPLQVAKEALLSVCASPPSIFILGRAFVPFRDFGDMGFSACIVSLRSWKARHACWNTILNGFCAGLECSSYHPCAEDMLRLVVRAKQVDFPQMDIERASQSIEFEGMLGLSFATDVPNVDISIAPLCPSGDEVLAAFGRLCPGVRPACGAACTRDRSTGYGSGLRCSSS